MRSLATIAACALTQTALVFGVLPESLPTVPIHGVDGIVAMPLFGIGTWQYNGSVAQAAVAAAFSLGYRHVDTALIYGNHDGVARALKNSGVPRDHLFVTTKIPGGLNSSATEKALDQCLQQLEVEYVDLMLFHFPDDFQGHGGPALRKEGWLALEKWAKAGKARAIGVSHFCKRQLQDVLSVATLPVAVNQVQYHVGMGHADRLATDDKDFVQSKGILYQSFSPLCGPCNPPDNAELLTGDLVTEIGKAHNKTGAQIALRWLVQQGIPVIPKTSKPTHLKENMHLFDFTLTAEEMARLSAADRPAVGGGPSATDSGDCSLELDALVV